MRTPDSKEVAPPGRSPNQQPVAVRPEVMIGELLLLLGVPGTLPSGAYTMPDLCSALTKASGAHHYAAVGLRDYPVFVSVKSGAPARVRLLVASALGGEWKKSDSSFTLVTKKPAPDEDFAEFCRLFKQADAGHSYARGASLKELYKLAPGHSIRYGDPPNAFVRPWSDEIKGVAVDRDFSDKRLLVHRMAPGAFEFPGMRGIEFSGLPKNVEDVLGEDLGKKALTAEMQAKIHSLSKDPAIAKALLADPMKKDPLAAFADLSLPGVGEAVRADMVVALPDLTIFALVGIGGGDGTVRACLGPYSMALVWDVVDGGIVGKLPLCERLTCAQADRGVMAKFLAAIGDRGVCDASALSAYVAAQNPAASDCWTDAMFLAMAGAAMDEEYIGDYPFNIRLYANLTDQDWAKLRSGRPFATAELSGPVQSSIMDVLLQSRARVAESPEDRPADVARAADAPEQPAPSDDPAWWPSLDMRSLVVKASVVDEDVLISWTNIGTDVVTVSSAASNYDLRKAELGREPLYQPAHRRKLKLTISSADGMHHVVTGFSAVQRNDSYKPGPWQKLPPAMAKEFENRAKPGDVPPPVDVKPMRQGRGEAACGRRRAGRERRTSLSGTSGSLSAASLLTHPLFLLASLAVTVPLHRSGPSSQPG